MPEWLLGPSLKGVLYVNTSSICQIALQMAKLPEKSRLVPHSNSFDRERHTPSMARPKLQTDAGVAK
jgi:hypothetical protein